MHYLIKFLSVNVFISGFFQKDLWFNGSGNLVGQVVTGVGFLGAGVIIAREGLVKGVTSVAVIWVLAGIGATIGFGYFTAAVALSVITVVILTGVQLLENSIRRLRRGVHARDGECNTPEE